MPVTIFFCYAHEDVSLLTKLKTHLSPLQRQGLIDVWHDRDVSAGEEWEQAISKHLNEAQIILLLISPDFMASEYCYSIEMQQALARHKRREARVIPIILRHIYWHGEPFGRLQALPTDAKPLISSSWYNLDEALYNVVEGLQKVIEELVTKPTDVLPVIPAQIPINTSCVCGARLIMKNHFLEDQKSVKSKKIAETFLIPPYQSFQL